MSFSHFLMECWNLSVSQITSFLSETAWAITQNTKPFCCATSSMKKCHLENIIYILTILQCILISRPENILSNIRGWNNSLPAVASFSLLITKNYRTVTWFSTLFKPFNLPRDTAMTMKWNTVFLFKRQILFFSSFFLGRDLFIFGSVLVCM